jgi:magnesium chelatase family protein
LAREITVEIDVARGLYNFSIIGLADKAVGESRDRIQSAIKNSGFKAPTQTNRKITVLLAPASIKKEGSGFDLAIAVAYLSAICDLRIDFEKFIFLAELSLSGALRAPKHYLFLFREILERNPNVVIVTAEECREISEKFINDRVIYCKNLNELINYF